MTKIELTEVIKDFNDDELQIIQLALMEADMHVMQNTDEGIKHPLSTLLGKAIDIVLAAQN